MKIFHTADWHLGKLVQGIYMTEDQAYVLEQFIVAVKEENPDIIIIAGDLYDRAIPPTEAVELLNNILEKLTLQLNKPVIAIAGNHDSPDRLDFATKLMEKNNLYLSGQIRYPLKPIVFNDQYGEVEVYTLPYADPSIVRYITGQEEIKNHDDAMRIVVEHIKQNWNEQARHILVGHAFVTKLGQPEQNTSDSERPLSIGGAEHVNASYLECFDYVALGHLHQAHFVQQEYIRYSGSPLKYSISEEHHQKGFLVVDLKEKGIVNIEKRSLTPIRDMKRIKATITELEKHPYNEDYVFVTLTDENPVLFPMERIRKVYPNAMHVDRQAKAVADANTSQLQTNETKSKLNPIQLFSAFYEEVNQQQLSEEKRQLFISIYEELERLEGEK